MQAFGPDRHGVRRFAFLHRGPPAGPDVRDLRGPLRRCLEACRGGQLRDDRAHVTDHRHRAFKVPADLGAIDVHLDDLRVRRDEAPALGGHAPQRGACDQHDVGAQQDRVGGICPVLTDDSAVERMVRGNRRQSVQCHDNGDRELLGQGDQLARRA